MKRIYFAEPAIEDTIEVIYDGAVGSINYQSDVVIFEDYEEYDLFMAIEIFTGSAGDFEDTPEEWARFINDIAKHNQNVLTYKQFREKYPNREHGKSRKDYVKYKIEQLQDELADYDDDEDFNKEIY